MKEIEIKLSQEAAEKYSHALSDILCFVEGVKAATENNKFIVLTDAAEDLRQLSLIIKKVLSEVK